MIDLKVCMEHAPAESDPISMSILSSAPVSLLRKKIGKRLNLDAFCLYTGKRVESGYERVALINEDEEVGWWLTSGDHVLVVKV